MKKKKQSAKIIPVMKGSTVLAHYTDVFISMAQCGLLEKKFIREVQSVSRRLLKGRDYLMRTPDWIVDCIESE
jgi:hypothetical protein